MPPDLNSLPPSRTPSSPGSPLAYSTLRRRSSASGVQHSDAPSSPRAVHTSSFAGTSSGPNAQRSPNTIRPSMGSERRRSSQIASVSLQEPPSSALRENLGSPLIPATRPRTPPMYTADPHHQRTPSLGQIHQQLENEQEAQVNRLLQMIRVQQDQLAALQENNPGSERDAPETTSGVDAIPGAASPSRPQHGRVSSHSRSPSASLAQPRSPLQRPSSLSRQSSRGVHVPSNMSSPSLRPLSSTRSQDEWTMPATRDENAFNQAETQMLQRENQMLKSRIRELERQLGELSTTTESSGQGIATTS